MIELINIKPGDMFVNSLVYICGFCSDSLSNSIQVTDNSGKSIIWPIVQNYFKVKL